MRHERGISPDLGALNQWFAGASPEAVLAHALTLWDRNITVVSSFGAESAVLLHMVAQVDRHVPVLLVDTLMLFPETLTYQADLTKHLGLTDVRRIGLSQSEASAQDRYGAMHLADPDRCCTLRKVEPLERALSGFRASISGRKRYQSGKRAEMSVFEPDTDGRAKINPLAGWDAARLTDYMERFDLPRHPLVSEGYRSIGCKPCTTKVQPGEDARAGRWRGTEKTECGIHLQERTHQ